MWRIEWTDSAIQMVWHTAQLYRHLRINFQRTPLADAIEAALP